MNKLFQATLQNSVDEIKNYVVAKGLIAEADLNGTTIPVGVNDQYADLTIDSYQTLSIVNYQNMGDKTTYRVDTMEFDEFVLQDRPSPGNALDAANGSSANFTTPTLNAIDLVAFAAIHDEAVETSIVRGQLPQLFLNKLSVKSGKNILQLGWFGNTDIVTDGSKKQNLYAKTNGWIKTAGIKLNNTQFDGTNIADVLDKLEASIDDKYIDRTKMAYFLPRKRFNEFQQLIASMHPNVSVGVDATTGRKANYYGEIRVIEDLTLNDYVGGAVAGGSGEVAVLGRIDSLTFGMAEDLMKNNTWREQKEFAWYTTNEMKPAYTLIAPNAVAVAFYDKAIV